jgi:hypothetical protein
MPLESGYSLVTGTGRAEIEFEDASVVYLADNSVLTFNELSATNGVPYTDIVVAVGHGDPECADPWCRAKCFRLDTPTDKIHGDDTRKRRICASTATWTPSP